MPLTLERSVAGPETGESYGYEILDGALAPLRRDSGLPVGDQHVLGEEPGQRCPRQQLYARHQCAAFDPAVG